LENVKEEATSGELGIGIDRMITLKCIFEGKVMRCGVDSLDTRQGSLVSYRIINMTNNVFHL
jgi:hypothetical protein